MTQAQAVVHRAGMGAASGTIDADPITTEVIRHGLDAAALQMKIALMRTAFSVAIYEAIDFAPAIYDRQVRLLAQAPSEPFFMGTMSFCVKAAVESVGGEEALEPGDIVFTNDPYRTGSHPQDAAFVMPVFHEDELIGYTAIKAHWLDIGAKAPYCTDTIDLYQEGTIFPGIKLFRAGEINEEFYRTILANTRVPAMVAGDINAQVVGVKTGANGLLRLVERYGLETFQRSVELMFDHGEAIVRSYFDRIPDGRYVANARMDDNGVTPGALDLEIVVEVDGSTVRVDYSNCPDAQAGPINSPLASTVSATRIAMMALAGGAQAPNEGHFRPVEVVTRPGSLFDPQAPSPCFFYFAPGVAALEAIYSTLAEAVPTAAPAESAGDWIVMVWWGLREASGEPWADGTGHPIGQGASARGDGANALMHIGGAGCRFSPAEVWEAKYAWKVERIELATDSAGPGKFRGGLGLDFRFRMLEDAWVTSAIERTTQGAKGVRGGERARPNGLKVTGPDGQPLEAHPGKNTALFLPKGTVVDLHTGGGGGFGEPAERDPEAVRRDLLLGYISEEKAREDYPHAFS